MEPPIQCHDSLANLGAAARLHAVGARVQRIGATKKLPYDGTFDPPTRLPASSNRRDITDIFSSSHILNACHGAASTSASIRLHQQDRQHWRQWLWQEQCTSFLQHHDCTADLSKLTIRLCEGRFVSHHDVTIGVEFGSRIIPVGPPASLEYGINNPQQATAAAGGSKAKKEQKQQHLKLSIWDTAGQENYLAVTRGYFRGASGALLVFDITRRNTFNSATRWLNDLRQIGEEHIVIILVGNKSDLASSSTVSGDTSQPNKRQVTREEAEEWCRANDVMKYVETSAKSGEGVERAFLEVAERIYQNIEAGRYDLNDKRSGVKTGSAGGARGVTLSRPDRQAAKKSGIAGGCC